MMRERVFVLIVKESEILEMTLAQTNYDKLVEIHVISACLIMGLLIIMIHLKRIRNAMMKGMKDLREFSNS